MRQQDMLSGLVYCTDCGSRYYLCRCGSWDESQYTFVCGKYHCYKEDCTPHTIKTAALRQIVLSEIRRVSARRGNIGTSCSSGLPAATRAE